MTVRREPGKWLRKKAKAGVRAHPAGTVAFYGPDDRRASKAVAAVIPSEGAEPTELRLWFVETHDARHDAQVLAEITEHLKARGVRSVAMMDRIIGCPHEEAIDYPEGEDCPTCPFWAGRDRWTGLPLEEEEAMAKTSKPTKARAPDVTAPIDSLVALLAAQLGASRVSDAVDEAQDIMFEAMESDDPRTRIKLARKALTVSADCADAYNMLAQEAAATVEEAIGLYEQGVAAGERALGPAAFEEDVGLFWGLLETRPYMRARHGLALALWAGGRGEEAIAHGQAMLELNPGDNQGIRYLVLNWLLALGRDADVAPLLKRYKGDDGTDWTWSAALASFRKGGDRPAARKALARAIAANRYVADYLLARKRPPRVLGPYITMGGQDEAASYAEAAAETWKAAPGALAWLAAVVGPPAARRRAGA